VCANTLVTDVPRALVAVVGAWPAGIGHLFAEAVDAFGIDARREVPAGAYDRFVRAFVVDAEIVRAGITIVLALGGRMRARSLEANVVRAQIAVVLAYRSTVGRVRTRPHEANVVSAGITIVLANRPTDGRVRTRALEAKVVSAWIAIVLAWRTADGTVRARTRLADVVGTRIAVVLTRRAGGGGVLAVTVHALIICAGVAIIAAPCGVRTVGFPAALFLGPGGRRRAHQRIWQGNRAGECQQPTRLADREASGTVP
jgi:hypothetical protein